MKKLLVATSALIAAGSAAALDVTLGGEVKSVISYDGTANSWSQAALGSVTSNGVTTSNSKMSITASGSSNGWDYSASLGMNGTASSMTLSNAAIGSVSLKDGTCGNFVDISGISTAQTSTHVTGVTGPCMEWSTGASLMGFGLNVAMDIADVQGTAQLGLTGDLAGLSAAAELMANGNFDAVLGTSVAGVGVSIEATGDINNLSTADYVAKLSTSAMGFDLGLTADNNTLGYSAAMGGLKFTGTAAGDLLGNLGIEYSANLAEGLDTKVAYAGATGDVTITTTLAF